MNVNDLCSGCEICKNSCPINCIQMKQDFFGFYKAKKDNRCIECGLCEKICPFRNIGINERFNVEYYALKNRDKRIQKLSSSGGAFEVLSKYVLEKDGVVYGAAFNENFNVNHIRITKIEELYKIMGSKYVQSNLNNIYKEIEKDLNNNKIVLFSGTGCQISGLKNMLKKSYDNIYTIEILCHGIPSEKVWESYKNYLCDKYNSKINYVSFRDKKYGWHAYSVKVGFANGKKYRKIVDNDIYMQSYLRGYNICEDCYRCPYKKRERIADITLGDLWGVRVKRFKDNEQGISLVSINSNKGKKLFSYIKDNCDLVKLENEKTKNVISNMTGYAEKVPEEKRKLFFEMIESEDFKNAYNYNIKRSVIYEIKIKIKSILKILLFILKNLLQKLNLT